MLWYPKRAFSQYSFHQDQSSRTAATLKGARTNAPEAGIYLLGSRGHGRGWFLHSNNSFRVFIAPSDNDTRTLRAGNISAPRWRHATRNHLCLSTHGTPPQATGGA